MELTSQEIENIVSKVLKNVISNEQVSYGCGCTGDVVKTYVPKTTQKTIDLVQNSFGVFKTMEEAITASFQAQKQYVKLEVKDRERIIQNIRKTTLENVELLSKTTIEETGLGKYKDKISKNTLVIEKTPGTEVLSTHAISGDDGLTIVEQAPYGVIGCITPVTNPTETIINNSISMLAGGNSPVFNVHPSAKRSCKLVVELINKAIYEICNIKNLVTMVEEPTMETVKELSSDERIRLLVGTGGMPMVRSLLQSGKKVVGAGAGNPPVVVDDTADIKLAGKKIYEGASFDNNILCLAEKEVFVDEKVANDLIYHMIDEGAYLLNNEQLQKIMDLVLTFDVTPSGKEYHVSKQWVGKDASKILQAIGVNDKENCNLIICDVENNHPFVILEQLMPVLPIVRCKNVDQAIEFAVIAERGNRHTASMFSKNVDNLTKFAKAIETTIFVKNSCTLAGVGMGGEGHSTMTIAGPTGEGITNAVTFTRQRRCVLAEGGFRVI